MKTRSLVGAMVLGVAMLLGGSRSSEAAWYPYGAPRFAVAYYRPFYRPFYRPWRPYFFAPAPRVIVRPYYRPHVSYFRAW